MLQSELHFLGTERVVRHAKDPAPGYTRDFVLLGPSEEIETMELGIGVGECPCHKVTLQQASAVTIFYTIIFCLLYVCFVH